jgi:hypothetical protein
VHVRAGTWIRNLVQSLAEDRRRSLRQMATCYGKTFTATTSCYRLIKHADAKRILFLVDRSNLGEQAKLEFDKFTIQKTQRKFHMHLGSAEIMHDQLIRLVDWSERPNISVHVVPSGIGACGVMPASPGWPLVAREHAPGCPSLGPGYRERAS